MSKVILDREDNVIRFAINEVERILAVEIAEEIPINSNLSFNVYVPNLCVILIIEVEYIDNPIDLYMKILELIKGSLINKLYK